MNLAFGDKLEGEGGYHHERFLGRGHSYNTRLQTHLIAILYGGDGVQLLGLASGIFYDFSYSASQLVCKRSSLE